MTSKPKSNTKSSSSMTPEAAQRIQSVTAKASDGTVPKQSFAARAARAAAKNNQ